MNDEVTTKPEVSRAARALCAALGHSYPVRMVRPGDVLRDVPEDLTYVGCVRCGREMTEVKRWWR